MRLAILAFTLGIILLQQAAQLPDALQLRLLLALSVTLLMLAGFIRLRWQRPRLVQVIATLASLMLGFAWASWRADVRLSEALPEAWEGRDIEIVGVVSTLPTALPQGQRFTFELEQVLTEAAVVPRQISLAWYSGRDAAEEGESQPEAWGRVTPGERWQFKVRLKRPHGNANPDLFDYEAWLLEHGIRATGYVRPGEARRLDRFVPGAGMWIESLRQHVRDRFFATLAPASYPLVGVLTALAIGDQRAIEPDLWNVFAKTGISHLVAISGMHISMIAALAGWGVAFVWRRVPYLALRIPAQKVAIPAVCLTALFYALLTGMAIPALRTVAMLLVAGTGVLIGRNLAVSRIWLLSLLAVVVWDPWAVLAPGFWLSFAAVGALLYVSSGRSAATGRQGGAALLRAWWRTQWAATLVSAPILLWVFQQFSLVSPLANAIAIPVISFVVTPLAILAALIPWHPLLVADHAILSVLMRVLRGLAEWPVWQAPAPSLGASLLAMAGVGLLLLPRGLPLRWLGGVLLAPLLFWHAPGPAEGEAKVTVLDVGQGLATVVRTQRHTLIYDPGPLYSAESDAGQRVVVPFLRARGVNRVDMMMVTHRDADHAGGMASVLAAVPVDQVSGSLNGLDRPCLAGQQWSWDGVHFSVLYPSALEYDATRLAQRVKDTKSNHLSCVLRVETLGGSVLLTSDIEMEDEAKLIQRMRDAQVGSLAANVLLVPHHGSRTSSTDEFLNQVAPQAAIIPVGYRSRFGHPKPEVLARYAEQQIPVWRTDRDGAVTVSLGAESGVDSPKIENWRAQRPRYWHGR